MWHSKKGCYISIPEMLEAAAGFEDLLRSLVGFSTDVIGASVWIDLGQKKTVNEETRSYLVQTYRPFTTCRPA